MDRFHHHIYIIFIKSFKTQQLLNWTKSFLIWVYMSHKNRDWPWEGTKRVFREGCPPCFNLTWLQLNSSPKTRTNIKNWEGRNNASRVTSEKEDEGINAGKIKFLTASSLSPDGSYINRNLLDISRIVRAQQVRKTSPGQWEEDINRSS